MSTPLTCEPAPNRVPPANNNRERTPYYLINQSKSHPKSKAITDEQLASEFSKYFDSLVNRGCCYSAFDKKKKRQCDCLCVMQNDLVRHSVCQFAIEFGKCNRYLQQLRLVDWYRYARPDRQGNQNNKCFLLLLDPKHPVPLDILPEGYKICTNALMALTDTGQGAWKRIINYAKGFLVVERHGLKGQSNRKRKPDDPIVIRLHKHFAILVGYGEVQATRFVREETGELTVRDDDDTSIYLPPTMAKRYCYRRYCKDNGYKVKTNSSGCVERVKMSDAELGMEDGTTEYHDCVSWGNYYEFWKEHYSHLLPFQFF